MKAKRITKTALDAQLRDAVMQCWILLAEYDFKECCNLTGLSISTIHRLYSGEYTCNVRFGTIQALATAAGLEIVFASSDVSLKFVH